jgi:hypothetical protein
MAALAAELAAEDRKGYVKVKEAANARDRGRHRDQEARLAG